MIKCSLLARYYSSLPSDDVLGIWQKRTEHGSRTLAIILLNSRITHDILSKIPNTFEREREKQWDRDRERQRQRETEKERVEKERVEKEQVEKERVEGVRADGVRVEGARVDKECE